MYREWMDVKDKGKDKRSFPEGKRILPEGNYCFPFFWLRQGRRQELPGRIQAVYESGCRAFCVESRIHEDFCGSEWWKDLGVILEEAGKRGMKVWILDDRHFPTGYANGALENHGEESGEESGRVERGGRKTGVEVSVGVPHEKEASERDKDRRWFLREHHVDVAGPMQEAAVLWPGLEPGEDVLAAVAWRRAGRGEELSGRGIDLTANAEGGFLYWDVPEGYYRIFFLIRTFRGRLQEQAAYISGLTGSSVRRLIQAVYEPHYAHFSRYFGTVLEGFFSDEPGLYSQQVGHWGEDAGQYYRTLGQPGLALPWVEELLSVMGERLAEEDVRPGDGEIYSLLPLLWYPARELSPQIRLAYMDGITKLWERYFSRQLGDWCREHGVLYTGHLIEDMGAHMRLGAGAGHYFRALSGQDISGIDIVLQQVLPGFDSHDAASIVAGGVAGSEFFHYVLPKLAVSLARMEPGMQGRAMCEVFGAYGWAEGTDCMKWLVDFLLVRGINRFVPHAFTDCYPDPDCPPHFGAAGNDPQFPGFSCLIPYVNQVCHLLEGGSLQADGGILYPAEGEWMSTPEYCTPDRIARVLYDAHVDFDILSLDYLEGGQIREGKLVVNGYEHTFLVVPYAKQYPKRLYQILGRMESQGLPVFWQDRQEDFDGFSEELIQRIRDRKLVWQYGDVPAGLRIGWFQRGSANWFMLFWEEIGEACDCVVVLPCEGAFLRIDLMGEKVTRGEADGGKVHVRLTPYQSCLIYFDDFAEESMKRVGAEERWEEASTPELLWEICLKEQGLEEVYRKVRETSPLFAITGRKGWPYFSGNIRYRTCLNLEFPGDWGIDLGYVGVTARLTVNGKDLGIRICPPYRWDISEVAMEGENLLEIEVANTLVHRVRDRFSEYMQIKPGGLLGPVRVFRIYKDCQDERRFLSIRNCNAEERMLAQRNLDVLRQWLKVAVKAGSIEAFERITASCEISDRA